MRPLTITIAVAGAAAILALGGVASAQPRRAGPPGEKPNAGGVTKPAGAGGAATAQSNTKPGPDEGDAAANPGATAGEDSSLYNCEKAKGKFKVNLAPDVELKDLVTWAYTFTCKNVIYNSAIATRAAKVTIKSPEAMSARQAWNVFLVALQSMGLTVVPKDNVLEIIEYAQAKTAPLPIYSKSRPSSNDQMVRMVLRPDHLNVDDMAAILTELKSKDGMVKPVPRAGVIVVTDFGSHIAKMGSLMISVDQPVVGERLYMIRVKFADAVQLSTTLNEILGTKEQAGAGGGGAAAPTGGRGRRNRRGEDGDLPVGTETGPAPSGPSGAEVESALPSKIMADERTNSLVLLASEPAYLRVKALVNRLDVSVDVEGSGNIFVYPLENGDAEEMATTLTSAISGIQQPSSGTTGNAPGGRNNRQTEPARPAAAPMPAGGEGTAFEGNVRVTHDKPTNSLVVVASFKDFVSLREVIRRLDVPRPQVYIEATIVEIGVDNGRELGTSWHAGMPFGENDEHLLIGGVQHSNLSSINVASLATATGLIGGALGELLPGSEELLGQSIPSFGIFFQALATTSNVNVLSSPHILTTDNEEAEISVGQNIPYQSTVVPGGFGAGADGGVSGFFQGSIQRQDVELNLKITPQINASDMVKLEIDLTINDIASQDFAGLGPSWSKRTLKDTVVVEDQQAVVLGGLISDKIISSESKVPLLGDIPVLGYLFKFTTKRKEKRNLLVLLTPYIVHSQSDLERIVERRVREQREFLRSYAAFAEVEYRPAMDYRRKRGLIAEINHVVQQVEEDQAQLDALEQREVGYPDGAIEYTPDATPPVEGQPEPEPPAGGAGEPGAGGAN
ncbi:MAG TPA: type II secretion system secretin GspD [Kofleriaceae bacterium]|nr:type II secretion system secretin GspD [Kofleriaceae bacterium]